MKKLLSLFKVGHMVLAVLLPTAAQAAQPSPMKAIIFDMGGVIVADCAIEQVMCIAEMLHLSPLTMANDLPGALLPAVLGQGDEQTALNQIAAKYGSRVPANWRERVGKNYTKYAVEQPGMLDLVRKLKKRGMLTPMLSDTIAFHASLNKKRGFMAAFDPIFLSYDLHMRKPNPRLYRHVVKALGLHPQECVFVDDQLENAQGATDMGMHGIQFTDLNALEQELKALGIAI